MRRVATGERWSLGGGGVVVVKGGAWWGRSQEEKTSKHTDKQERGRVKEGKPERFVGG